MSFKMISRVILGAFLVLQTIPLPARAQEGASWLRTSAIPNALNPNISVIGDFVGAAGPRDDEASGRFALRETEISLQSAVDPYARADFFVAVHEGESPELEEGYVTLLALPFGLQARGGKFLANFGRLNMVHAPERPQVDGPVALAQFLGEEGLGGTGFEVSRIFGPFGLFTELSYALLNDLGHEHGGEEADVVYVAAFDENGAAITDPNGNPLNVPVDVRPAEEEAPRGVRRFGHVSRLRFFADLTDAWNLDLGFSGALRQPQGSEQVRMAAVDLTFRWKPLGVPNRSFIWRTEGLYSSRKLEEARDFTGAVTRPATELDRRGIYSYAEVQAARRWRFGARGDYSEDPEAKDATLTRPDGTAFTAAKSITRAVSPYVTFAASEFQRWRAQYQRLRLPNGEDEDRGFLQWTVVLGPHGGHPF